MQKIKAIISVVLCILLTVPIILVSCNNSPTSSSPPFFPVLKEPNPINFDLLAVGRLSLEDNCLRLKPLALFGESLLLIWPYGYTLKIEGKKIRVVDNNGIVVASVGDKIKVGGGEISLEMVEEYIGEPLSDNCTGPYWRVSKIIEE
jgi:hypothetical protein